MLDQFYPLPLHSQQIESHTHNAFTNKVLVTLIVELQRWHDWPNAQAHTGWQAQGANRLHNLVSEQVSSSGKPQRLKRDNQPKAFSKIRRVKCDEAVPACKRCTSTGRKCDGYGPRPKKPAASDSDCDLANVKPIRQRRAVNSEATTGAVSVYGAPATTTYTILRPLMADISGSRMERMYFHRFRDIGEEALGIRHVHSGLFWRQIVPQYCTEVPSVKHAYIAFAAAYTHFHVAGRRPDSNSAPTEAERFVIQQYSTAMEQISQDCGGLPLRRRYGITMMCCVAFFCIEVLRGDLRQALVHLANGIRMMADLPEDVADILHNPAKWSQGLDTSHVRVAYMIKLLTRWEVSVGHLAADFQPLLTAQAYSARQHEQVPVRARSVEALQDAVDDFCQDVNVLAWMARSQAGAGFGEDMYWSDPAHRLQYWSLKQRGDSIARLFTEHEVVQGGSYKKGTREHLAMNVSLLRHRVSALTLDLLPFDAQDVLSPYAEAERIQELVVVAETIQSEHEDGGDLDMSHVDVGVVPTLHVAAKLCRDDTTKQRLLGLIKQWPRKESLWDGLVMREMQVC